MEAYGKWDKMTSNSIGYPWKVPPSLPENREQNRNNDGRRGYEHIEDAEGEEKLETGRGRESTWIELHPHTIMGHIIIGTL